MTTDVARGARRATGSVTRINGGEWTTDDTIM